MALLARGQSKSSKLIKVNRNTSNMKNDNMQNNQVLMAVM